MSYHLKDETRFQNIRSMPGIEVVHMHTKRTTDTLLKLDGETLAWRTETLKRGKVIHTGYLFYRGESEILPLNKEEV